MITDRAILTGAAQTLGLHLDDGQFEALQVFAGILAGRAVDAGIVSDADRDRVLERHVVDCLRVLPLLRRGDSLCLDLGSGAGLPGIVVAIGAPRSSVELIDSRRRRIAFLELATQTLGLRNVAIRHSRIEDVRATADVCLARALASPARAWALARPLLGPRGRLLYFAGGGSTIRIEGPSAPALRLVPSPLLESSGPLVIMAQQ